jgi:hypothetical protein
MSEALVMLARKGDCLSPGTIPALIKLSMDNTMNRWMDEKTRKDGMIKD